MATDGARVGVGADRRCNTPPTTSAPAPSAISETAAVSTLGAQAGAAPVEQLLSRGPVGSHCPGAASQTLVSRTAPTATIPAPVISQIAAC